MLLSILATTWPSTASADPVELGPIGNRLSPQERNLSELACQLERALNSDNATLRSIALRLSASGAADHAEVVSTLRALRPELARSRTLSNRRLDRQPPLHASDSQRTAFGSLKSDSLKLSWGQPLELNQSSETDPPIRTIWFARNS